MKISLIHFSILMFAQIGIYGFCWLTFLYCDIVAKVKGVGGFLVLSLTNLVSLGLLYPIYLGLFQSSISTQLFPFISVLWLLSFYIYFVWMNQELSLTPGKTLYALRAAIFVMGLITFFFRLEKFRMVFFPELVSKGAETFIEHSLSSVVSSWGEAVILALGGLVIFAHGRLCWGVIKTKKRNRSKLLVFNSFLGLLISGYDVLVLMGLIDYAPLTSLIYLVPMVHFLSLAFSAPYFNIYATKELLRSETSTGPLPKLKFRRKLNSVEIHVMINHILSILKENYGDKVALSPLHIDREFVLRGEKTEFIVLFYNLIERAFDRASQRKAEDGEVEVSFSWADGPEVTIVFKEDSIDEKLMTMEKDLSKKTGLELSFKRQDERSYYVLKEGL